MVMDRRARIKAAIQDRTRESYDRRDDSGQFKNIFKDEFSGKLWKCGEGEHQIDPIPYVCGNNDPKLHPGEDAYVLHLWVHYGVGVNQDAYICPARSGYNKPCPICEYREDLRRGDDFDQDLVKELTPKHRNILNILCYDSEKEEGKGVQIFDVAHWFFEKHFSELAKMPSRGVGKSTDSFIYYADPTEGKTLCFTRKGTSRNTEFIGHKFLDRDYTIPDEILDAAFPIDDCVNYHTYDEIKTAFLGGSSDVAPVEEASAPAPPPVQEGGLRPRRTMNTPPAEPSPAATPRARTRPNPSPAPPAATDEMVCPVEGGTFGKDCENFTECNGCPLWNPCSEEADRMIAEAEGAQPEPQAKPTARPTPRPAVPTTPRPGPAAGGAPTGPRRGLTPRR